MPDDRLTPKQRRFVQEYQVDSCATRAAIRAGYSAKNADVTGPRQLGNVGIREAIEKAREKMRQRTEVTVETMTERYEALAKFAQKDSDKLHALDSQCKLHGLFVDKVKAKVKVESDWSSYLRTLTDEELQRIAEATSRPLRPVEPSQAAEKAMLGTGDRPGRETA